MTLWLCVHSLIHSIKLIQSFLSSTFHKSNLFSFHQILRGNLKGSNLCSFNYNKKDVSFFSTQLPVGSFIVASYDDVRIRRRTNLSLRLKRVEACLSNFPKQKNFHHYREFLHRLKSLASFGQWNVIYDWRAGQWERYSDEAHIRTSSAGM